MAYACITAVAAAGGFPAAAQARPAHTSTTRSRVQYVSSAAAFEVAVATDVNVGGTIVLLPHRYASTLVVGPRGTVQLRIVGSRRSRVQALVLDHTQSVTMRGFSVRAMTHDGGVLARDSRSLVFRHMRFTAQGTRHRVSLDLSHSHRVMVRDSEFSHCGDGTPEWSMCLYPRYASSVTVQHNVFHDCRGCDFIHGRAGPFFTVRDNRFMRALKCNQRWVKCGHSDLIELFGADHMTVARNVFGVNQIGGAQLYMTNAVDHVRVIDNLFWRTDPKAPGVVPRVGVLVGGRITPRIPHDVLIEDNTILSGKPLPDQDCFPKCPNHAASSIVLSTRYSTLPKAQRPVIANNIIGRLLAPGLVCPLARVSVGNVVAVGTACGGGDVTADPLLDAHARPTAGSVALIDRANPRFAAPRDLRSHVRVGRPDIGAYEYVPACSAPMQCTSLSPSPDPQAGCGGVAGGSTVAALSTWEEPDCWAIRA